MNVAPLPNQLLYDDIAMGEVASVFAQVQAISSRLEMTHLVAQLLRRVNAQDAQILMYFVQGTLKPPYLNSKFSIAHKTIMKVIARLGAITLEEATALYEQSGDVGCLIDHIAWEGTAQLSLNQVYQRLCALQDVEGAGSQEEKIQQMCDLLERLNRVSVKYVLRIIVGTLRLGCSDMTLIDALSWMITGDKSLHDDLEDAYTICADLGRIAYVLKDKGIDAVRAMGITVGVPIRPAAAERLENAAAIIEKIGSCSVQPKLDGFRLQIHVDFTGSQPIIRLFSRNLLDMSDMFPEITHMCTTLGVKTLIADGEAIVYDPDTGSFLPFQTTIKRKRKHAIDQASQDLPLQFYFFDLLYLNGRSLLDVTQTERRALLEKVCSHAIQQPTAIVTQQQSIFDTESASSIAQSKVCNIIEQVLVTSAQELEHYFFKTVADGLEGVVVKRPDSLYQAGKRNFNWIKLKYQAASKLNDSIDVVVLGYYYGKGKRSALGIGAFLVGIYNAQKEQFETVAKIGTGLTDQEWKEMKHLLDGCRTPEQLSNVVCAKDLYPSVWVRPEIVCEVLADEITISPLHTAGRDDHTLGYALRFPRFLKRRFDKDPLQTTSVQELIDMHQRMHLVVHDKSMH